MKREESELHREALRQGQEYSRKMVEEYDTLWGQPFWDYVRKSRAARLARSGADGRRAIDAGRGIGFTAFEAAASGLFSEIVALDMSVEALAIAEKLKAEHSRAHAAEIIKFVQGDFFMLQADASFDVVYMHEVFEHIPSAEAVFAKARKLLTSGGFLIISTPNRDRLFNRLRVAAGRRRLLIDPFHVREYSFRKWPRRGPAGALRRQPAGSCTIPIASPRRSRLPEARSGISWEKPCVFWPRTGSFTGPALCSQG